MVYNTGATVVPVVVDTFFNLSFRDFILRRRKVVISILKPLSKNEIINVENPEVLDFQRATQVVIDRMKEIL